MKPGATTVPRHFSALNGIRLLLASQILLALWALDIPDAVSGLDRRDPIPAVAPQSALPLTLESGQSTAIQIARSWNADSRLISAVMRVEWPADMLPGAEIALPDAGWIVYVFAHAESTLSIYLDRRSGAYITSVTGDSGDESWVAVDFTGHSRSSATALLTAEVLEGVNYRASCPDTRTTAFVTFTRIPDKSGIETSVWTVTYGDTRFDGTHDVLVRIDALNGHVLTSEARERPCGG